MLQNVSSQPESLSFFRDARLEPGDFERRWRSARVSGLRAVLGQSGESSHTASEEELLKSIPPEKRAAVLREVFDHSRRLGLSLSRYLGLSAESSDFAEFLPESPVPCFRGRWQSKEGSIVLSREGCSIPEETGSFACDYWREALDGLVVGAGRDTRLARHRCAGHGDSQCVDVIFDDDGSEPKMGLHRGEIPAEFAGGLRELSEDFARQGVSVRWNGFSEGILFYRMEAGSNPLCGAGGRLLHETLLSKLKSRFPALRAQDDSPLAVYGGPQ